MGWVPSSFRCGPSCRGLRKDDRQKQIIITQWKSSLGVLNKVPCQNTRSVQWDGDRGQGSRGSRVGKILNSQEGEMGVQTTVTEQRQGAKEHSV